MGDTEKERETVREGERGRLTEETKKRKNYVLFLGNCVAKDELVGGQQKSFVGVPLMRSTKTVFFFIGFTVT